MLIMNVLLMGNDAGSGIKSIALRFGDDIFLPHPPSVSIKVRTLDVAKNEVKFRLYAENEIDDSSKVLKDNFFIALVVDLNKLSSSNLEIYFDELIKQIPSHDSTAPTIIVLGNKSDLPREISDNQFHVCAEKYGCLSAIISAKTGEGIERAFSRAAEDQLAKKGIISSDYEKSNSDKNNNSPLYSKSKYSPAMYPKQEQQVRYINALLIGNDAGEGKKSIASRFGNNLFLPHLTAVGMKLKTLEVADNKVTFRLYAENEIDDPRKILEDAFVIALVVDLTKLSSSNIDCHLANLIKKIPSHDSTTPTIIVLGNKSDLPREISDNEFHLCAEKYRCLSAIVSAKTGEGVEQAFITAAKAELSKDDDPKQSLCNIM